MRFTHLREHDDARRTMMSMHLERATLTIQMGRPNKTGKLSTIAMKCVMSAYRRAGTRCSRNGSETTYAIRRFHSAIWLEGGGMQFYTLDAFFFCCVLHRHRHRCLVFNANYLWLHHQTAGARL